MSTTNKALNVPAHGSNVNNWDVPVNANWNAIDSAFGGVTTLSVTGQSGTIGLSSSQYTPPNIEISGTLTANVTYQIPSGVGGVWTVQNSATGAYTVSLSSGSGGASVTIPQGKRIMVCADGTSSGIQIATTSAVTASFGDSSQSIATTAFVQGAIQAAPKLITPQTVYNATGSSGGFNTYNLASSPFNLPSTAHIGIFTTFFNAAINSANIIHARDSSGGIWANSGAGIVVFSTTDTSGTNTGGYTGMYMVPLTSSQTCDFSVDVPSGTSTTINLVGYF